MVRPTAALTVPLSRAKDLTPLASILHVLGTRARLETLQLLMDGPRLSAELPARADELHMLEDIGVIESTRVADGRLGYEWSLVPGALERIARCLTSSERWGSGDTSGPARAGDHQLGRGLHLWLCRCENRERFPMRSESTSSSMVWVSVSLDSGHVRREVSNSATTSS